MLRTLLFTPGDNPRRMARAAASDADAAVLDLEDAVAPTAKNRARKHVRSFLEQWTGAKPLFIRTNAVGTDEFHADMDVLGSRLTKAYGLVVPKADSVDRLVDLDAELQHLESRDETATSPLKLLAVLESALGILSAQAIANAPRVERLIFGTLDLAAELGVAPSDSGQEFLNARSHVVLASRAAGLGGPLDGPHTRVDDLNGLTNSTRTARELGYHGKVIIHPAQIPTVHTVLSPSKIQLEHAYRVLEAYRTAQAQGLGAARLDDGTFIDQPVVIAAADILGLTLEEASS